ncbi:MAG: hypothetical protein ACF8Q5_11525 [Phycisphaerales bacterium JB040]
MRRSTTIRSRRDAFTVVEMLIAIAILLAIAGVTLPVLLTRGLDDARADLLVRLNASLLDAQREAMRTGETTRLVWVQPESDTPKTPRRNVTEESATLVIERMPSTSRDEATLDDRLGESLGDRWLDSPGADDRVPSGADSDDSAGGETGPGSAPAGTLRAVVAYALPDGTLVPGETGLVLSLRGSLYRLEVIPIESGASLTEVSEEDLAEMTGEPVQNGSNGNDPESLMDEFDQAPESGWGAP